MLLGEVSPAMESPAKAFDWEFLPWAIHNWVLVKQPWGVDLPAQVSWWWCSLGARAVV